MGNDVVDQSLLTGLRVLSGAARLAGPNVRHQLAVDQFNADRAESVEVLVPVIVIGSGAGRFRRRETWAMVA